MTIPTVGAWKQLQGRGRFLVVKPRLVWQFQWQGVVDQISAYGDSDWAGCRKTVKSTSGGVVLLGNHAVKSWSSTQAVIALSSGEAEYYGLVKGA